MMKTLLSILLVLALMLPIVGQAQTVTAIIGGNVACDTTVDSCLFFPAAPSILCNGSGGNLDCPQWWHPDWSQSPGTRFFGVTNRANPPRYLTSTTGAVWTLTTAQPWVAAVLNFGGQIAVSSNGSLIAVSGQGANLCEIRRSTDQGAIWATVFTSLVQSCSVLFGNPTAPGLYCEQTSGYCGFIVQSSGATVTVIFSTDNGANWSIGTTYAHNSGDSRTFGPILSSDGGGVLIRGTNSSAGQPFGTKGAADFVATPALVTAISLNCRPLVMGTNKRAFCRPNAGGVTSRFMTGGALGVAPVELSNFTTADVPTSGGSQDFNPAGFNSTYAYAVTGSFTPSTRYNIYISANGGSSFVLTSQLTPTTTPIFACCTGNFMRWGSKMYFSSGATSSQAIFAVIQ